MEEEWIVENVKKSFLMAFEGYMAAFPCAEQVEVEILAPVAAEVFRMVTQPILVTVDDDVRIGRGKLEELKHSVEKLGYRGIVCAGGMKMEFPYSTPIELNVEGIIEEEVTKVENS
jgi:hypothetical protein